MKNTIMHHYAAYFCQLAIVTFVFVNGLQYALCFLTLYVSFSMQKLYPPGTVSWAYAQGRFVFTWPAQVLPVNCHSITKLLHLNSHEPYCIILYHS